MNKFRTLRADEIDCRVSQVKENGVTLLLYKDARCDQNILDETVGPMNWQRFHSRENANCTVQIWDDEKRQWIGKEDVGTPSNTEADKGLASDSFKRACFNWGVGRELYSAPFVFVTAERCNIKKQNNGRLTCNDHFSVTEIGYRPDGARDICKLIITNDKTKQVVYNWTDTDVRPVQEETPAPLDRYNPTPVEPAEVPHNNSRKAIIDKMCEKLKITTAAFGNYKKAAVANNIIPDKMVNSLTEDEFGQLLNFVEANANAGTA